MSSMGKNSKSGSHGSNSKKSSTLATIAAAQAAQDGEIEGAATSGTAAATASVGGVVNIPIIKTKENNKQLPVYYAALQRSGDDYLPVEDLDKMQADLETMLSNVALRYRVIRSEYESLDKDEKRNERKAKHASASLAVGGANSAAGSGGTAGSHSKRRRDDSGRKSKHSVKHRNSKSGPQLGHTDDSNDYVPSGGSGTAQGGKSQGPHSSRGEQKPGANVPKNDIPNKFWLSVEPYCMPITNEDLRLLDDLLEQYKGPLVPPIPELGPHYSTVWATEDLKDIQQNSNPNRLKAQNNNNPTSTGGAIEAMLKRGESLLDDGVAGPLTQRLVSALMEENLLQGHDLASITTDTTSNSSSENTHSSSQLNFRSLSMLRNGIGLEKRLKKELIDQGILDFGDFPNDEDEIYMEIKRLTSELTAISEYNSSELRRLRDVSKEEIKRLEIKRKLDAVDQEILETYKRIQQNKVKRKPLSVEEQQDIFRLTAEQKSLSDQLERAAAQCFLYE